MQRKLTQTWYLGVTVMLLLAVGIMFISIWRQIDKQVEQALVGTDNNREVLLAGEGVKIDDAILMDHESLPRSKYLPHHPLYLMKMIYQRVGLWLTLGDMDKVRLLENYADERMGVSEQMLALGKGREAIEAGAKGYMYDLQAAEILRLYQTDEAKSLWTHLAGAIGFHERAMVILETAVTDNYKPKVNLIVAGLERLRREAMVKGGVD